jgi:hypothetical protein
MNYFIMKRGQGLCIMIVPDEDLDVFYQELGHLVITHAKTIMDCLLSDQFTAWRAANPDNE